MTSQYSKKNSANSLKGIEKAPTGVNGLDEITYGGIPRGRPTLICGNTGCGKSLLSLEILFRGAVDFNEPGVLFAFEETKEDVIKNAASLGFNLEELQKKKMILIEYIYVDTRGYTETGEYDLEGLFIRIDQAVKSIGAKRVVLDTIEVLFSGFLNQAILRAELRRLFLWFKERQLTVIVTGEQGTGSLLTRHGIEEYVADCVIHLSHRITEEFSTRRIQIVKYRGSYHETNEFPFLINKKGVFILPVTTLLLQTTPSNKRITSGIPQLDIELGGNGFFEGSSILVSGDAGSGKTSFAAAFAQSICREKKRCLFISYEESEPELVRNFLTIGIDMKKYVESGCLRFLSQRPTQLGLEGHLGKFLEEIEEFKPDAVVIDPISTLIHCGSEAQIYSILVRMIDYLKKKGITAYITQLFTRGEDKEFFLGITSIIDTWIRLRNLEVDRELKRSLLILKSRAMAHTNQIKEFTISSKGIEIKQFHPGQGGFLVERRRIEQERRDLVESGEHIHEKMDLKKKLRKMQVKALEKESQQSYKKSSGASRLSKQKLRVGYAKKRQK